MDIAGKVTIITGASSGIGAATARLAAQRGAHCVLAARRTDRLEALAAEIGGAQVVTTDMRDAAQISALVDATLAEHGRVDVLVNNAGQGLHLPLDEVRLEDLIAITELNLYAPLLAMQAVLAPMRRQGSGAIVNVSSGTSRMTLPGAGAYAATKCALNMLSDIARAEFEPDGIIVSNVLPFITATEFHDSLRAGGMPAGARPPFEPDPPEKVAEVILGLIASGEREATMFPGAMGQRP